MKFKKFILWMLAVLLCLIGVIGLYQNVNAKSIIVPGTTQVINAGETKNVKVIKSGESQWFVFTPSDTGRYLLKSVGEADTICTYYTKKDGNQLNQEGWERSGSVGQNFGVKLYLAAGTTYYFEVGIAGGGTGNFDLVLEKLNFAIDPSNLSMELGEKKQLELQITPEEYEGDFAGKITYNSSNTSIATVDEDGNVEAVGQGVCVINVSFSNIGMCSATITVGLPSPIARLSVGQQQTVSIETGGQSGWYTLKPKGTGNYQLLTSSTLNEKVRLYKRNSKNKLVSVKLTKQAKGQYMVHLNVNTMYYYRIQFQSHTDIGDIVITLRFKGNKAISTSSGITVKQAVINRLLNKRTRRLYVSIQKIKLAKKYQIMIATDQKFKRNKWTCYSQQNSTVIARLLKGKRYYVKVRAYAVNTQGKRIYGKYSKVKSVWILR